MRVAVRGIVGVITEVYLDGQVTAIATCIIMGLVFFFCIIIYSPQRPQKIVQDTADLRSSIVTTVIREHG
jgi:hypothetical protein